MPALVWRYQWEGKIRNRGGLCCGWTQYNESSLYIVTALFILAFRRLFGPQCLRTSSWLRQIQLKRMLSVLWEISLVNYAILRISFHASQCFDMFFGQVEPQLRTCRNPHSLSMASKGSDSFDGGQHRFHKLEAEYHDMHGGATFAAGACN